MSAPRRRSRSVSRCGFCHPSSPTAAIADEPQRSAVASATSENSDSLPIRLRVPASCARYRRPRPCGSTKARTGSARADAFTGRSLWCRCVELLDDLTTVRIVAFDDFNPFDRIATASGVGRCARTRIVAHRTVTAASVLMWGQNVECREVGAAGQGSRQSK